MTQMDRLLTAADVAALLRKSLPSFYQLRHRGDGPPAVRIDGRLRFRPEDVRRWLEDHVEAGADA
jgi:predicted DNA-binding transcriptional regulator AlpA